MDHVNGEFGVGAAVSIDLPHRPAANTQEASAAKELSPKDSKSSNGHKASKSRSDPLRARDKQAESVKPPSNANTEENRNAKPSAKSGTSTTELPEFVLKRNELFEELKKKADVELLQKERHEIDVVLDLGLGKDGKPRPLMPVAAKACESTPGSFLRHVDKDVSTDVVIAKIDGKLLWDLDRPLEYSCRVSYLPFTSAEGRNVFWHSSAHVLGEAAECQYNCLLSHGPPVEQGFFYDMAIADG